MSVQASSLMAAIAALTSLVWRTVIENRMAWRRARPDSGVPPRRRRPGCPGSAAPTGQLVDEPFGPAGGVGRAGAHAQVEQLAGVGPAGPQRGVGTLGGGGGRGPRHWQ